MVLNLQDVIIAGNIILDLVAKQTPLLTNEYKDKFSSIIDVENWSLLLKLQIDDRDHGILVCKSLERVEAIPTIQRGWICLLTIIEG